jgi:ribosome-associated protein
MERIDFKLKDDYIELIKLLKLLKIAESGGQAKMFVENGEVVVNCKKETRKRAKIRRDDKIEIFNFEIVII